MRVFFDQIPDDGITFNVEESYEDYAVLKELSNSGECRFLLPISIHVEFRVLGAMVEVRGKLRTQVQLTCSRCLKQYDHDLSSDFHLMYESRPHKFDEPISDKEIELSTEDVGLLFFDGVVIDTRQGLLEEILAEIPIKPLCHKRCKGLCHRCGADLNTRSCNCERNDIDPRLEILRTLKVRDT